MKKDGKVQTTLRLTPELAKYVRAKASEIGIPTNSFLMVLIDRGLKLYESDVIQLVEAPNQ